MYLMLQGLCSAFDIIIFNTLHPVALLLKPSTAIKVNVVDRMLEGRNGAELLL